MKSELVVHPEFDRIAREINEDLNNRRCTPDGKVMMTENELREHLGLPTIPYWGDKVGYMFNKEKES